MEPPEPIPVTNLTVSQMQVSNELHVSGGLRAALQPGKLWSLFPALNGQEITSLTPMPIQQVDKIASDVGEVLFGGDEITDAEGPLPSRIWTPLNGPSSGAMDPAILWSAIAQGADKAVDPTYGRLARNIAVSMRAAAIRLRDASDGYHRQLSAALVENAKAGKRFSNIPMADIHLAFHSVLTELASVRDYLAAALANQLGAPTKIDAMNRFSDWLKPASKAALKDAPIVAAMLAAYDPTSADPWLHELTDYRNLFLHKSPMGTSNHARWLIVLEKTVGPVTLNVINMPLSLNDPWAPGEDALRRFIGLFRRMNQLLKNAADQAPHKPFFPHFVTT